LLERFPTTGMRQLLWEGRIRFKVKRSCSNAPDPPLVSGATSARQMVCAVYFEWRACVSRTIGAIDYVARRSGVTTSAVGGQCGLAGINKKPGKPGSWR
jgi:hypothetical protein